MHAMQLVLAAVMAIQRPATPATPPLELVGQFDAL